jgi:oxygen-independent coproporphyrinogen-3 oxidase
VSPATGASSPATGASTPIGPGLYVHIPFCQRRCDYCAFATWTDRHHLAAEYVDACIEEFARSEPDGWGEPATVFLGGGTPSQLAPDDLVRLVRSFGAPAGAEVTAEANPEDVTPDWLAACSEAGVTRISLGVQSLDPVVLRGLGRLHDPGAVASAVAAIGAAGIGSYSVDLIYGGAGETDDSWLASLTGVLHLDPSPAHVSAYALTVEPGTPLWRDPTRHPDDDDQAHRYELADGALSAAGLSWYEISNWSKPGHESLHNRNYWAQGDYIGIGCAAHSHRAGRRWWNMRTPERYIAAIRAQQPPVAASEMLDDATRALERLELGLRTSDGVPASALPMGDEALEGLVEVQGGRAVLTLRGRMLANEVACRLQHEIS